MMTTASESKPKTDLVTLADAAEQLGVHYMTAYRYVRTGRMMAEKRAGQWWVTPEEVTAVIAAGTGPRRRDPGAKPTSRDMRVAPFTDRLVAGDTAGCWDMINDALCAGATPVEVHTRLLGAALARVGDEWRAGELSVSDEHRATSTANRLLGQMGPLFRHRGRRRGTIVLGNVAGDPHAMPTAMLSDLLCDRRFEVIDLGANTPTESFVEAAGSCDDLVGIGMCVVLDELVPHAITQLQELRDALPETFLLVGGPAVERAQLTLFEPLADAVSIGAIDACDAFETAADRA